jgi:NAD(P)-dependent dehydrogenase (short-subunit alcohol dehydrogenase family)
MSTARFEGQVVVVTGGAQGIGLGVARQMAAEGAQVVIWSRSNALSAAAALGHEALGIQADVTSEQSVSAALTATLSAFGKIDVLVTSAGIGANLCQVQDMDFAAWQQVINTNLNGTFLCCRAVLPGMVERNYGRIVTVASLAGKEPKPKISAYAASKAAVIAFTKSLGMELATTNVRANTFTPGAIDTPMTQKLPPEVRKMIVSMVPQQRMGTVEECAALIGFMASRECSFNSGAVFDLTGGLASY